MAKTANVAFPTWTAIENSIQLTTPDSMALYTGDKLSVDSQGDTFSIIAIVSIDVLEDKAIFELKPDISTNFHMVSVGMRNVIEAGGYFFELTIHRPDSGFDTYTLFKAYDADTDTENNLQAGIPYHLCITNENVTVGSTITEVVLKAFVNGKQMSSDTASNFPWAVSDGPVDFLHMEAQMKVGAVKLYDRVLSPLFIKQDYERASDISAVSFSDISSFYVSDVNERELNGQFGPPESAQLTSSTAGTYKVLSSNLVSSFPVDVITGLPGAGEGHWGSICSFASDSFTAEHTVLSVVGVDDIPNSPYGSAGTVTLTIADTASPTAGEQIFLRGVNAYVSGVGWAIESTHVITTVGATFGGSITLTIDVIIYATTWTLIPATQAKINFNYPASFDTSIDLPGSLRTLQHIYSPLVEGTPYTVRVRGIGLEGLVSPWVESSVVAGRDLLSPNPIYTEINRGGGRVAVSLDFERNSSGTIDIEFHNEVNIEKVQVVMCAESLDRFDGAGDPGANSNPTGTTGRRIVDISLPRDIGNLRQRTFLIEDVEGAQDLYVWTRLVTTSGEASDWFPNDSGDASTRDRFAAVPVLIGLGPISINNNSADNLVTDADSTDYEVDTATTDSQGPGANSGVGGIFNTIP